MTADEPVAGVPRLCARRADCTRPRGHDDECGPDRVQARVARYAAALSSARLDAVLKVADTELADLRAEVERLEGEYQHVRQLLDADRATLLAVEGALGVCGCQATADVVARRVVAERDALQRQVDAVLGQVGHACRLLALSGQSGAAATVRAQVARWPEFVDAVEPADQPAEDPVVTEAKRRCAEYCASLPAGVSTEATWQDWAPGGFYYEPADQPHPTPEAPDLLAALQQSIDRARAAREDEAAP